MATLKILYHQIKKGTDCPDGLAAAWAAHRAYFATTVSTEVIGVSYGDEPPLVEQGDMVVIVDFSYPWEVLQRMKSRGALVFLFDHHKTALDTISGFENVILDMSESGATLVWKKHFSQPVPAFLQYIKDRDLWEWKLPHSKEINEAIAIVRYDIRSAVRVEEYARELIFAWFDRLAKMTEAQLISYLLPIGEPIIRQKIERVEAIAARFEWYWLPPSTATSVYEYKIPVVKLVEDGSEDRLTSDICSVLYKRFPDAPFVACINSLGDWSLRSDKDGNNTDVAAIAQLFGGGGHRNAAGFKNQNKPNEEAQTCQA